MNKKEIKLLKNNDERDWPDIEWVKEFYHFLQGDLPDSIGTSRGHGVKLNHKKAWTIVWYLQEHFPILPDQIEKCDVCNCLFDTHSEGIYWETKQKHFCGGCDHLVPINYDRGKR